MGVALCWFHQDLRLGDNPVLDAAIASGDAVIPFIFWMMRRQATGPWAGQAGGGCIIASLI